MLDITINLRARSVQRDLIGRAAGTLGKNRSDFMLEAACEKAQAIVLDRTFFALDDTAFARFSALLSADHETGASRTFVVADETRIVRGYMLREWVATLCGIRSYLPGIALCTGSHDLRSTYFLP